MITPTANGGCGGPSTVQRQEQLLRTRIEVERACAIARKSKFRSAGADSPRTAPALTRTHPGGCQAEFLNCGSSLCQPMSSTCRDSAEDPNFVSGNIEMLRKIAGIPSPGWSRWRYGTLSQINALRWRCRRGPLSFRGREWRPGSPAPRQVRGGRLRAEPLARNALEQRAEMT